MAPTYPPTGIDDPEEEPTAPTEPGALDLDATDLVPVLLDGRYRILSHIAKGGMAVVHLAEHVALQRKVALKVLHPPEDVRNRYDFASWFRVEAQTLARFRHPNIVTPFDFGKLDADRFYLVMEYIDGPTLLEEMEKGPLEPRRVLGLMGQLAEALRYTHARGVVHRDVKPSNLLLAAEEDGDGEVLKLIDFGISETGRGGLRPANDHFLGSPHCMSPEQIAGEDVGAAADLYSLGCVLFRALTGRYPFQRRDVKAVLIAHLQQPVPTLEEVAPDLDLPPGTASLVRRLLAKDPADRPASADALVVEIQSLLLPTPAPLPEPEPAPLREMGPEDTLSAPRPEPPRASIMPVLMVGAALILALVAVGVVWVQSGDPQGAADAAPVLVEAPAQAPVTPAPAEAPGAQDEPPPQAEPATEPEPSAPEAAPPEPEPVRQPSRRTTRKAPRKTASPTPEPTPSEGSTQPEPEAPDGYKAMPEFLRPAT